MTISRKVNTQEDGLIMNIPEALPIEEWVHYFATILFWFGYSAENFEEVFGKDWDNV